MRPVIRLFEERDQDAVIALSLRAWAPVFASLEGILGESGVYSRLHPDWRADQRRAVEATCHTDGDPVWVAEVDGVVAGFVAAHLDHQVGIGEISMLAVDPDYQRRGFGSALTSAALDWIKNSGMGVAMVETGGDPGHSAARHTYQRAGFVLLPVARFFKPL